MRHRLVLEVPEAGLFPLTEPFEVGSLGAEIFSHITQVCRRISPFELGPEAIHALRSAIHTGLLWGHLPPVETLAPKPGTVISHVRMLAEQPNGMWAPSHDFELGR